MCAGWVGDHEIPPVVEDVSNIPLIVRPRLVRGDQVARQGIVALCDESIPDGPTELAGD